MSQTQTMAINPDEADLSTSGIKKIMDQPGMTKSDVRKAKKRIRKSRGQ